MTVACLPINQAGTTGNRVPKGSLPRAGIGARLAIPAVGTRTGRGRSKPGGWGSAAGALGVRRDEGDGRRGSAGLYRPGQMARRCSSRRAGVSPQGSRAAVSPDRHHLRGLWRGRCPGAADPVRRHPAHPVGEGMGHAAPRTGAARQGDQRLSPRHLRPARNSQGRHRARGPGVPESGVPSGDERPEGAARHLCAHRRHRRGPRRRRHVLCARGQRPHPVRGLLHAGEPRDHDAAVPGIVLARTGWRRWRIIPTSCWRR